MSSPVFSFPREEGRKVEGTFMNRRNFLVNLGLISTTVTVSGCGKGHDSQTAGAGASPGPGEADLTWGKAPCRYCGTGCGVEVGVADGKVMAVKGDVASPVNRGLLCVKGYHLPAMLYGKDRCSIR